MPPGRVPPGGHTVGPAGKLAAGHIAGGQTGAGGRTVEGPTGAGGRTVVGAVANTLVRTAVVAPVEQNPVDLHGDAREPTLGALS